jgi:hypothetical protein
MKETAFGHPSNSLDAETAIHIVDAQTECSKTTPFVNDTEKLEMASLLHEMKTDIEKGLTIDLRILMNRIAAIFPFCEKLKEPETIQSALMAHSVHGQQRAMSYDRDDTQHKWKKEKSQNQEDNAIRHLTNEMDKLTKAMNDFK